MLSYYCLSPRGRDFLYIPYNLFAYTYSRTGNVNFRLEPEILQKIGFAIGKGFLSRDRLEDKGWDVHEINVSDKMVKRFRNLCFRTKNLDKRLEMAVDIFDFISDCYETFSEEGEDQNQSQNQDFDMQGTMKIVQEGGYEEDIYYNDEDFSEDWWLRGEDPPCFE